MINNAIFLYCGVGNKNRHMIGLGVATKQTSVTKQTNWLHCFLTWRQVLDVFNKYNIPMPNATDHEYGHELNRYITSWILLFTCSHHSCVQQLQNSNVLRNRSWIWPWIKSVYNELDIAFHVLAPQLSHRVIHLWRHQLSNVTSSTEPEQS